MVLSYVYDFRTCRQNPIQGRSSSRDAVSSICGLKMMMMHITWDGEKVFQGRHCLLVKEEMIIFGPLELE